MKCFFCGEEIAENTPVCPWCGRRQQEMTENKPPSNSSSTETYSSNYYVEVEQAKSEDTGWKCKNCGNFNVRTDKCSNCGKQKGSIPEQRPTTNAVTPKQSKAEEYYEKGVKSFMEMFGETDKGKVSGYLTKAQGYLTMAYKAADDNTEEKKGIAGLMALVLTYMEDYKNAETWAEAEFAINPTNVFAKLAWYDIELDKLIHHRGFVTGSDGSGFGLFASILTTGVDAARVQDKKRAVIKAGREAAKAIEKRAQTETDPNLANWLFWSLMLMRIIENMWANNMKEPYLCNVILNLPWNRFSIEQIKDLQEVIEEMQVEAHGYLSRLK